MESCQGIQYGTHKYHKCRTQAHFSTETFEGQEGMGCCTLSSERQLPTPTTTYNKTVNCNSRKKNFHDKNKLKELVTIKPYL